MQQQHSLVERKKRILVLACGSVATIKIPEIVASLCDEEGGGKGNCEVRLILSGPASLHFMNRASKNKYAAAWKRFLACGGPDMIIWDDEEWSTWQSMGDRVLHIELRKWADVLLVAPASADVLAKASCGISDTLLLSVMRAWDVKNKPCLVCPAMNTLMWLHPTTSSAITTLESWKYVVLGPVEKVLACKDEGMGALSPVEDILNKVHEVLANVAVPASMSNSGGEGGGAISSSANGAGSIELLSSSWPKSWSALWRRTRMAFLHGKGLDCDVRVAKIAKLTFELTFIFVAVLSTKGMPSLQSLNVWLWRRRAF